MSLATVVRGLDGYGCLTELGRDYLEDAIVLGTSRPFGQKSLKSASGFLAPDENDESVGFESRGVERLFVLWTRHHCASHAQLHQPKKLTILRHDARGNRYTRPYTTDYLDFLPARFRLVETKPLATIEGLASKYPKDFIRSENGAWRWLPGEQRATSYGMDFLLFYPEAHPKALLDNLSILTKLPKTDVVAERPKLVAHVAEKLRAGPKSLLELCRMFDGLTAGYIYQAIQQGRLFGLTDRQQFDLDFLVFGAAEQAQKHRLEIEKLRAPALAEIGPMHLKYLRASEAATRDGRIASEKYEARRKAGAGFDSTDYKYKALLAKARREGAPEAAAFIPNYADRGGDGPALDKNDAKIIHKHAVEHIKTVPKSTPTSGFGAYLVQAKDNGQYIPSPETYRKIYRCALAPEQASFYQGGKRGFQQSKPLVDGRDVVTQLQIAGLRAHMDGVYGDVLSERDEEGLYLRPIVYPIIDESTGYVFGRGLKIGRPSRLAVAMAFRDTYRRHGFLPSEVFHDWGSEFVNEFAADLRFHFRVDFGRRPVGAPRYGAKIEAFNAQLNSFLQRLAGGMYFDKAGRSADGDKKSRSTANLSLAEIVREIDKWIFEYWNKTPHAGETESPEQLYLKSKLVFPEAFVSVVDDEMSRYVTSFPLDASSFSYNRGYRFGGTRFGSDDLSAKLRLSNSVRFPRLDSEDPSLIWVKSDGGLVPLSARSYKKVLGSDAGGAAEIFNSLLAYNTNARINQIGKAEKEARQLRDHEKTVEAIRSSKEQEGEQDTDEAIGRAPPVSKPNFSEAARLVRTQLKRLGDLDTLEDK